MALQLIKQKNHFDVIVTELREKEKPLFIHKINQKRISKRSAIFAALAQHSKSRVSQQLLIILDKYSILRIKADFNIIFL